jgi:hypothetical protein
MRKLVMEKAAICIFAAPSAILKGSPRQSSEEQMLKVQQKQERANFKLRERNMKDSFRGHQVPTAVRVQQERQLQREKRAMRERQKNQLQDLRDRQKMMKAASRG